MFFTYKYFRRNILKKGVFLNQISELSSSVAQTMVKEKPQFSA